MEYLRQIKQHLERQVAEDGGGNGDGSGAQEKEVELHSSCRQRQIYQNFCFWFPPPEVSFAIEGRYGHCCKVEGIHRRRDNIPIRTYQKCLTRHAKQIVHLRIIEIFLTNGERIYKPNLTFVTVFDVVVTRTVVDAARGLGKSCAIQQDESYQDTRCESQWRAGKEVATKEWFVCRGNLQFRSPERPESFTISTTLHWQFHTLSVTRNA